MKIIKKKISIFIIVIFCALFGAAVLFATKMNHPTVAHANEFSETAMTNNATIDPLEVITSIEDELQEHGTSILKVLHSQRDSYFGELDSALGEARKIILAKIETLDQAIARFENNAFNLPNNYNYETDNTNKISTLSFGISPNCTCTEANILLDSPCGNCMIYSNTSMAVSAIAAGFEVRGWSLANDLIWFNMSNTTLDIDYWPSRGNQIAQAPQIANDVAQSNHLTEAFNQESPGRLNGLFESTIEGDTYNSLGSFIRCKKHTMMDF